MTVGKIIGFAMAVSFALSPFTVRAAGGNSAAEVNRELSNPVSETWSLGFEQNNYFLDADSSEDSRWSPDLNFEPLMPLSLTGNWNLITLPVLPLFVTQLYTGMQAGSSSGNGIKTSTGFGDITLTEMFAPGGKVAGNWLLGFGPTFIFPTASDDFTGQGKWQIGPAAVFGYLSENRILGVFVRNWTSFAGDTSRPDRNSMNLEPIAVFFFPDGWSVGYSGKILANWKADSGNVWTVPLGMGVGKMVRPGVKIDLAVEWMPVHPDKFGQQWNFRLRLSSVIPELFKGPLFE